MMHAMTQRWPVLAVFLALLLTGGALLLWMPEAAALPRRDEPTPAMAPQEPITDANLRSAIDVGAAFGQQLEAAMTGRQQQHLVMAEPADPLAGVVRGRLCVRQKPWQALADVEVMLTESWLDTVLPIELGDADEPLPPLRGPRVRTDAQGRFTLAFVPPAGELFFLIGSGSPWADFQKVDHLPRAGETTDLGDVMVDDRGSCSGRIFSAVDGKPLAHVEVRGVDNPLLAADLDTDELRSERARGLEYFRAAGFYNGQPLPRWVAQRDRLLPFPRTRTDANGRFVLTGLRQGVHDLFFQGQDTYGQYPGICIAGDETTDLGGFYLDVASTQTVQVLHEDKQTPWIGAYLTALPRNFAFTPPPCATDFSGKATLHGLDPELDYWLLFRYPQGGGYVRLGRFELRDGQTPQFFIDEPPEIALLLVDEAGRAVPDASVSLLQSGGALRAPDQLLPRWYQPVEESHGRFRARRPPGSIVALAIAPGKAPAVAQLGREDSVTITMVRGVDVRVQCFDRQRRPVAGARVIAQLHADPFRRFAGAHWTALADTRIALGHSDDRGELQIHGLWPTRITFAAEHPAFVRSPAATRQVGDGQSIELLLRQRAEVRGVVTMDVHPVGKGMRVRLGNALPEVNELHDNPFLSSRVAVTAADGSFAFRDLVAGMYELRPLLPKEHAGDDRQAARRDRYQPLQVVVSEGQELHVELEATRQFAATPTLVGKFSLDGVGVAGALVRVRHVIDADELASWLAIPDLERRERTLQRYAPERLGPDPWLLRTHTDAFGNYAFEDLSEGKWELRIDAPWQGRLQFVTQTVVEVAEPKRGDSTHQDLDLPTGSVRLWVLGADSQPVAGRMIQLQRQGPFTEAPTTVDLLTDRRGCIELDNLPAGSWTAAPTTHGERFVDPSLIVRRRDFVDHGFALTR